MLSSETSINSHQTTWHYVPEDGKLQSRRKFIGILRKRTSLSWQKCIKMDVTEIRMKCEKNKKRIMCNSQISVSLAPNPWLVLPWDFIIASINQWFIVIWTRHEGPPHSAQATYCTRRPRDILGIIGFQECPCKPIHTEPHPIGVSVPVAVNKFLCFIKWM